MNEVKPTSGVFLPLLLVGLAVLGWAVFQTVELRLAHGSLTRVYAAQEKGVENAGKLRASLSELASDTQKLADAGDAGAKVIVENLRRRGITIHPSATVSH